jgi:hypothetical protein
MIENRNDSAAVYAGISDAFQATTVVEEDGIIEGFPLFVKKEWKIEYE